MNREEALAVFEKVKAHLLKQNERSEDPFQNCLYRGPRGLKCAIGCLIPDELYRPVFGAMSVRSVLFSYSAESVFGFTVDKMDLAMLSRLQQVHDLHFVQGWPEALAVIYNDYFGVNGEYLGLRARQGGVRRRRSRPTHKHRLNQKNRRDNS